MAVAGYGRSVGLLVTDCLCEPELLPSGQGPVPCPQQHLTGLLAPRERNKTITCLAGAEPVAGGEAEQVNDRRLELLREESATAPHEGGVIVIDDSGDRKDGTATAHVGRQWLGRLGKTDNGIVTVTTVWTDGRVYYPLHARPYTPARHFARGRSDLAFRTKPQLMRDHRSDLLPTWMDRVLADDLHALHSLVSGLRRDIHAVTAAFSTSWSSGQVEGHVTRVKLLKRMGFGRANLDLLRRRVLRSP
ncbi:transposase [Streptomyces sp. NBC_01728]|nr:transposase [Streptomyces sp. NBC_01719]MCX4499373.1 transposase [Streptomyces sp. NBC_01728]